MGDWQRRRMQKVVSNFMGWPRLDVDVISTIYPEEKTLYTVPLCGVEQNEINLNGGRFQLFSHDDQAHLVIYHFDRRGEFSDAFVERLDWIAANAVSLWSFDLNIPSLSTETYINWTFLERNDALRFKLTF